MNKNMSSQNEIESVENRLLRQQCLALAAQSEGGSLTACDVVAIAEIFFHFVAKGEVPTVKESRAKTA
jgi:hypothetical protein